MCKLIKIKTKGLDALHKETRWLDLSRDDELESSLTDGRSQDFVSNQDKRRNRWQVGFFNLQS